MGRYLFLEEPEKANDKLQVSEKARAGFDSGDFYVGAFQTSCGCVSVSRLVGACDGEGLGGPQWGKHRIPATEGCWGLQPMPYESVIYIGGPLLVF